LSRALAVGAGESRRFIEIKKPTRLYADGGSLQGANLRVTAQKQAKKNIKSRRSFPQCRQECPAIGLETAHQNPHIVVVVLDDLRPDDARSFFIRLLMMAEFDYRAAAELFPTRGRPRGRQSFGYKRFAQASQAIRFAIEDLPPECLVGAFLEVDEQRYGHDDIRRLYESAEYPLERRQQRS
jgi:hypothetical protein